MSEEENTETLREEEYPPHLLIEAALFSAGKPVSEEEISETTGIDRPLIRLYMKKLTQSYSRRETSLEVIKAGKKYTLRIKEQYVQKVTSLANPEVPAKLLKTAALIAYHQPIRQSELVEMYGSKVYDHVKELYSLGLVRARREGSTKVLTTTHRFSEVFGIGSVSKKKVKGHVRDRVLDKLDRITLRDYDPDVEGEEESGAEIANEEVSDPSDEQGSQNNPDPDPETGNSPVTEGDPDGSNDNPPDE
ncbi:MAG: SMC-Scp complex subunit ScpB [Thermoplasmatota archaeon]